VPRWLRRLLLTAPIVVLAFSALVAAARPPQPADADPAEATRTRGVEEGVHAAPAVLNRLSVDAVAPGASVWIDTGDRRAVIEAYERELAAAAPALQWSGDHDRCDGGTSSVASRQATLRRVNFYRAMAGVPAVITEDPDLTARAHLAAIMMSVEGTLTHSPPDTFACFTPDGQQAAANSNLYLGRTGPEAIDGYIEDPGAGNTDVGHRNTILHPPTRTMGVGNIAGSGDGYSANALWVFDDQVFDETSVRRPPVREPERFVAWPPRGYVPHELVHPRWSFMLAGADFSRAEVALFRVDAGDARPVPVEIVDRTGAPGHVPLPAVVWEPELISDFAVDETYLVVISSVEPLEPEAIMASPFDQGGPLAAAGSGVASSYAYTVRIIGHDAASVTPVTEVLAGIARR
jgi:uncharacterized protein YkwD